MIAQLGIGVRRHADDVRHAEVARQLENFQHLDRLAAGRERDHHVVFADHAEVAVRGFGGMDEVGRRCGGAQRGGELAGDVACLCRCRWSALCRGTRAGSGLRFRSRRRCVTERIAFASASSTARIRSLMFIAEVAVLRRAAWCQMRPPRSS